MSEKASVEVFSFKDGLLARLAHDLRLSIEDFEVQLREGEVRARFSLDSLCVDGVMERGVLVASALSDKDRTQILRHATQDVLHSARFPEALYEGRLSGPADAPRLSGTLTLRGAAKPVDVEIELDQAHILARSRLRLTTWGILPFKALGGAIRLQDVVEVRLRLPRRIPGLEADWRDSDCAWRGSPRVA